MINKVCADLVRKDKTIAVAESFTGGNVAASLVKYPGISKVFLCSTVAYSNKAKHEIIGVPNEILDKFGAVSSQCAVSMAECVRKNIGSDIGVATTGFAGPASDDDNFPVGTYFIAVSTDDQTYVRKYHCDGNRDVVTNDGVLAVFEFINDIISKQ